MSHTLIFDADELKYKYGFANEVAIDWEGDGNLSVSAHLDDAIEGIEDFIADTMRKLKADDLIVTLTCPEHNFRKDIMGDYKANRKNSRKPKLISELEDYLKSEYKTYIRFSLEADDCCGILGTHPRLIKGKKTIVSQDKDMRTLPTNIYNPNRPELGIIKVNELDADRFFMWQTIVGDMTDGYGGVPRVGKASVYAQDVLLCDSIEDMWDCVLEAYGSKGLTETDAIKQARMARILRHTDYNYKNREVILWEPPILYV